VTRRVDMALFLDTSFVIALEMARDMSKRRKL
jgi:hypothetical protein